MLLISRLIKELLKSENYEETIYLGKKAIISKFIVTVFVILWHYSFI